MSQRSLLSRLLLLVFFVSGKLRGNEMCEPALQHLVKHGVATLDIIRQLPSSNGSSICGGGACCVPSLSQPMMGRGRHLIHIAVQRELDQLSNKITIASDDFRVAIIEALKNSEVRTLLSLKLSYPRLVDHARAPLQKLFLDFHSSLSNIEDEDLIERALETFWNDLFPMVYHSIIHKRLPPFSPAYVDCLRESRSKIRPWKNLHKPMGDTLVRGLEAIRLMIYLLSVASETVSKARQYRIPEECGEPAARLYFCSACHGAIVAPCYGLCLNVARGCLAPMAEVDTHWSSLASTTVSLDTSIKNSKITKLLNEFPERLSDAIMIVMESGPKLQKMIRSKCGQYTHTLYGETKAKTGEAESLDGASNHEEVSLKKYNLELLAQKAVDVMDKSHGFWASLADGLCVVPAPLDKNCWNGMFVSEYNRATIGLGTSAQKYNAEVTVAKYDTELFSLPNHLRSAKQLVTRRLTSMPYSMNYRRSEEDIDGSGFNGRGHHNRNSDDDDSEDDSFEGSGSGDGNIPVKPIDGPFLAACPECNESKANKASIAIILGGLFSILLFKKGLHV